MEPRLKSGLWVSAYLRRCEHDGASGYVVRKGDETAGSVLVRVNLLDGRARLLEATFNDKGERVWMPVFKDDIGAETEADDYVRRALSRDPDIWVVEIEDRAGNAHLDGF